MWFSEKAVVDRVLSGGPKIRITEVEKDRDRIPDEVIEHDTSIIKPNFPKNAWQIVQETSEF